jgi:hypothetical protein
MTRSMDMGRVAPPAGRDLLPAEHAPGGTPDIDRARRVSEALECGIEESLEIKFLCMEGIEDP